MATWRTSRTPRHWWAIKEGFFTKNLGNGVTLKLTPFSTGTEEATALLAGQLDAAYVGPNPAIKAFQTSGGKLIKVISGAASGGAALVVKTGITSASQLKGQKLATPSLGNTQDVALRYWLKQHNLTTTQAGGGDVPITPVTPNSAAVDEFASGQIAGGWEPAAVRRRDGRRRRPRDGRRGQPVAGRQVRDHPAGGAVVLPEGPPGRDQRAAQGRRSQATDFLNNNKSEAEQAANAQLATLTGKSLKPDILAETFKYITFTDDPIASSLLTDAQHATAVGLLDPISNLSTHLSTSIRSTSCCPQQGNRR